MGMGLQRGRNFSWRQQEEEVTEEAKRVMTQETMGGYSLSEEALLASEAQDQSAAW